ncbi:4-alpha-glucanotransferase [Candidatus Fermentibacteria bacterium]|nr:4-alpha-glucanotransferase [Candidatus Fermentibacteria bacterium]
MLHRRSAGILMHPTSLPGPGGVGDLGPSCHQFLDFAAAAKASLWQVLPLGPTGYGGSPYQCTSSFAGNPLLISLEWLRDHGLLDRDVLQHPLPSGAHTMLREAASLKERALQAAFDRFRAQGSAGQWSEEFSRFKDEQSWWLEDYALCAALKEEHDGAPWFEWPQELRARDVDALRDAGLRRGDRIEYRRFVQFVWWLQWQEVRAEARRRGILIMGDIPIFPAHDSADVWANQAFFKLDEKGQPFMVAGVPPDYFSKTGQLWGNPVYRWDVIEDTGFDWWAKRLGYTFSLVDIIRLDHFRGFMAAWEVPAGEMTAVHGQWVPGPGRRIFEHLGRTVGTLPIVAENLGVITPDVEAARQEFAFPGMNILQFAFDSDSANPHLPHNQGKDVVTYTGTHDNDTTVGWFAAAGDGVKGYLREYLDRSEPRIPYDLIRLAYASAANTAVVPLQDVLGLDGNARMNYPGRQEGNWGWRFTADQLQDHHVRPLADLARAFGRLPESE